MIDIFLDDVRILNAGFFGSAFQMTALSNACVLGAIQFLVFFVLVVFVFHPLVKFFDFVGDIEGL